MIKGEVTLIFTDKDTGEITKQHTQTNVVTLRKIKELTRSDSWAKWGTEIFVSTWKQDTVRPSEANMFMIDEIGVTQSGTTTPKYLTNSTTGDYYIQHEKFFGFKGYDRTIHMIGVTRENTDFTYNNSDPDIVGYRRKEVDAYLRLEPSCTQLSNENLTIIYRVIYHNENTATNLSTYQQKLLRYSDTDTQSESYEQSLMVDYAQSFFSLHPVLDDRVKPIYSNNKLGGRMPNHSSWNEWNYVTKPVNVSASITDLMGRIVSRIHPGITGYYAGQSVLSTKLLDDDVSPIQTIYPHNVTATKPFYDSSTTATGQGTISVDGSGWDNTGYPAFAKINITNTGSVGTSEYTISIRDSFGFVNNTYRDVPAPMLWMDDDGGRTDGGWHSHGMPHAIHSSYYDADNRAVAQHYYDDYILIADRYYIGRIKLMTGESKNIRASTVPSAGFTHINGFAIDDSLNVWVADETGLYKISSDWNTVTHITNATTGLTTLTSSNALGVDIGNGKVWVAFPEGLAFTSDGGNSFTLRDTTTTPAYGTTFNSADVRGVYCDRNHADDRVAVLVNDNAAGESSGYIEGDIRWWDGVIGDHTNYIYRVVRSHEWYGNPTMSQAAVSLFNHCTISCSPTGEWGVPYHRSSPNGGEEACLFNFGDSAPYYTTDVNRNWAFDTSRQRVMWEQDGDGTWGFWINNAGNYYYFIKTDGTITQSADMGSSTAVPGLDWQGNWSINIGTGETFVYLPNAKVVAKMYGTISLRLLHTIAMPNWPADGGSYGNIIWRHYGWDGANWVEGHSGSKVTHATSESLPEGLAISFDDSAGTEQFVATEYFTFGVCDGVWMDGATEFSHTHAPWFRYPAKFNQTEVMSDTTVGVIPSAPYIPLEYSAYNDYEKRMRGYYSDITWVDRSGSGTVSAGNTLPTNYGTGNIHSYTTDQEITNGDEGYFSVYKGSDISHTVSSHVLIGLRDTAKKGAPATINDVDYGIYMTTENGTYASSVNQYSLYIRENGVNVFAITEPLTGGDTIATSRTFEDRFYVERKASGEVNYYYCHQLLYTSLVSSTTDLAGTVVKQDGPEIKWTFLATGSQPDYYVQLGTEALSTGRFDSQFYRMVPNEGWGKFEFYINGVKATQIAINDTDTVLNAGEISVFDAAGLVRCSAADAGLPITAKYISLFYK